MKHLPAHPDADQCTLSPRPAGHSLTPTTPARSSRSTREHPATIAWGHARPERRGHAYSYMYMISRALLLHETARQSSRRPPPRQRASARIRPSPARRRCCSSCAAAGWWPWCLCWLGLTRTAGTACSSTTGRPTTTGGAQGISSASERSEPPSWDATALGAVVCLSWL